MASETSQYIEFQIRPDGEIVIKPKLVAFLGSLICLPFVILGPGITLTLIEQQQWVGLCILLIIFLGSIILFLKGVWAAIAPEVIFKPTNKLINVRSFFPSQRMSVEFDAINGLVVHNFVMFKTIDLRCGNGRSIPLIITDGWITWEGQDAVEANVVLDSLATLIPSLLDWRSSPYSRSLVK